MEVEKLGTPASTMEKSISADMEGGGSQVCNICAILLAVPVGLCRAMTLRVSQRALAGQMP